MNSVRVVIADDETLAREKIKAFLTRNESVEVVAECKNGEEVLDAINNQDPDIILLDIQMPSMSGMEILENFSGLTKPKFILTTAYDQYAVSAFDHQVSDYLLKPFDRLRFEKALSKVINEIRSEQQSKGYLKRLPIKNKSQIQFVDVHSITHIQANGNTLRIVIQDAKEHSLRKSMSEIMRLLDPDIFVRIHRSSIVNLNYIKNVQHWSKGDYVVTLETNKSLFTSKGYRDKFLELLKS